MGVHSNHLGSKVTVTVWAKVHWLCTRWPIDSTDVCDAVFVHNLPFAAAFTQIRVAAKADKAEGVVSCP